MKERFLNRKAIRSICGISNSTIDRWVESGKLPKPIAIHGNARRWVASELEQVLGIHIIEDTGPSVDTADRYLTAREVMARVGLSRHTDFKINHLNRAVSNNRLWASSTLDVVRR